MKLDRFIRLAIGFAILIAFIVATGMLLFVTESALNIWDRLAGGPAWVLYAYLAILVFIFIIAAFTLWKLLVKRDGGKTSTRSDKQLSKQDIETRLRDAEAVGMDVEAAQSELQTLAARREGGVVHLCFFGEVSTGKSSLIRALSPEADVKIDVVGGSTDDIRHFSWRNDDGLEVLLTDVPGTGGHDEGFDELAKEEARRSHIVLYVCDSDLTRSDTAALRELFGFDKPLVLVLNKADRFDVEEQAELMRKLLERLEEIGGDALRDRIVAVSAGGEMDVIEKRTDGTELARRRQRPADVGVLVFAVNLMLEQQSDLLDERRDRAVFRLAAEKLELAEAAYREQRAEQIIRSSTRKAIVGALAAVSPGADIFIQGYIGTAMTQELCGVYGASPRDLDVEQFLNLSQGRVGKALPLSLAVAGNGLKAFPGIGTVAGGIVHAVAYGLIFDALGRSLVHTLSRHGELVPDVAAKEFEEGISEHIEAGVRRVAAMALEEKTGLK